MLKEILQKPSKTEVHFSYKTTKKERIHQQDKVPYQRFQTVNYIQLLYSIGGALPLPLIDIYAIINFRILIFEGIWL